MTLTIASVLALAVLIGGCALFAPDSATISQPSADGGTADFDVFVSLGNSLTAGYQSGALYESTQGYGFASLLAQAMGVPLELPLIADPGIYDAALGLGHLSVVFDEEGDASLVPIPWPGGTMPDFLNATLPGPYHNLGVPGALTVDLLQAFDAASSAAGDNAYFDIILRNAAIDWTQLGGPAADLTAVEQAILLQPTFMSLWIGNNEILGAATEGSGTPLVDAGTFEILYVDNLLALLTANLPDTKMVLANIPSVTSAPFFTTVPWFVIDPDQNPVDGDPETDGIQFIGLIAEDGGPDFQLEAGDLVLLKLLSYDEGPDAPNGVPDLEEGMGIPDAVLIGLLMAQGYSEEDAIALLPVAFPLHNTLIPGSLTLSAAELAELTQATADFNAVIEGAGTTFDFPVVDNNAIMADIAANGYDYNEHHYTAEFVSGGIFSLDGIHPSNIGNAILAEEFIAVINDFYGANLVNPGVPHVPARALPIGKIDSMPASFPNLP